MAEIPVPCKNCGGRVMVHPEHDRDANYCDTCTKVLAFFKPHLSAIGQFESTIQRIVDLEVNARLDRDRISELEDTVWKLVQKVGR